MFFGRLQIFERGKIFRVKSFFLLFVVVYIFSVVRKMNRVVNLVTRDRMVANKVKKFTNSQFGVPQSEAGENSAQI